MRIAVCDDCLEDALYLKAMLGGQSVRTYSDTASLLADVESGRVRYDLYLLDIFMELAGNIFEDGRKGEGGRSLKGKEPVDGIDLARQLRVLDSEAAICFVSTSDAFYREAYDLYAIQYLVKPVQEDAMQQLLDRVAKNLVRDKEQSLCFKRGGQTGAIPYRKILFISSREHTVSIYCKDGTVQECKGKLSEMEAQIRGDVFLRCHQSFLVNMYQIDYINGSELMVAGHRIPISRRYYAEVKRRYQEVLFEEVD